MSSFSDLIFSCSASVEECPKGKTFVPEKYFEYGTKYKLLPGDTHREAGRNQFPEKVLAKLPPVEDVKGKHFFPLNY